MRVGSLREAGMGLFEKVDLWWRLHVVELEEDRISMTRRLEHSQALEIIMLLVSADARDDLPVELCQEYYIMR